MLRFRGPARYSREVSCNRISPSKLAFTLLVFALSRLGYTQQISVSVSVKGLPAAPERSTLDPNADAVLDRQPPPSISGIIMDANGGIISGASVTLTSARDLEERKLLSDSNGGFSFSGLPAGNFKLTITSPGMEPFVFPDIVLNADERRELPQSPWRSQARRRK